MKIKIGINCIGCGLCANICPHVFELKNGRAQVIEEVNLKKNKTCVKDAALNCPMQQIQILKEDVNKF